MPTLIVTISELKVRLGALMAELEVQGIPFYVTQHGKPKAVLARYDEYEALDQEGRGPGRFARHEGFPLGTGG